MHHPVYSQFLFSSFRSSLFEHHTIIHNKKILTVNNEKKNCTNNHFSEGWQECMYIFFFRYGTEPKKITYRDYSVIKDWVG